MREKLIDLIVQGNIMAFGRSESFAEIIADNLIAHGVTVQEWIPVTERLPDKECLAVCMLAGRPAYNEMLVGWVGKDAMCETGYICESNGEILPDVTHWMPLPQPPKGEKE